MALFSASVLLWGLQSAALAADPWSWKAEAVPPGQGVELVLPAGASEIEIWTDPVAPVEVAANGVVLAPACVVGGHWYGTVDASSLTIHHQGGGPVSVLAGSAAASACGEQATEEPTTEPAPERPTEEPTKQPAPDRPTEEPTKQPAPERPTAEPTKEPVRERPTQEPVRPTEEPVREQRTGVKPTEEPVRERATSEPGRQGAVQAERGEAPQVAAATSSRGNGSPSVPGRNARSAFRGTATPLRFSSQASLVGGVVGGHSALAPEVAGPALPLPVAAGSAPPGAADRRLSDPPPPPADANPAVLVVADAGQGPFVPRLPLELFAAGALGFVALRLGTSRAASRES